MLLRLLQSANLAIRHAIRVLEEWWFDASRHVRTSGDSPFRDSGALVGDINDGVHYIPARAANARAALRDLPIDDPSTYTFVDLGSGKGRMLFVAAEFSFRRIVGVEFSTRLHAQTLQNIARYSCRKREHPAIESILANALDYQFPGGNLVLYLFNPFGPETMRRVLANLERSICDSPRHVILVLLWPENANLVAQMGSMRACRATRRYQIFESLPAAHPHPVARPPRDDIYSSAP